MYCFSEAIDKNIYPINPSICNNDILFKHFYHHHHQQHQHQHQQQQQQQTKMSLLHIQSNCNTQSQWKKDFLLLPVLLILCSQWWHRSMAIESIQRKEFVFEALVRIQGGWENTTNQTSNDTAWGYFCIAKYKI